MQKIIRLLAKPHVLIWLLLPGLALAAIVTAAQVTQAILNSPNSSAQLKQYATAIGDLAINVESSGNTTAYNRTCCYGILQMTQINIWNTLKITPTQYLQLDLQDQVDAWAKLTSPLLNTSTVQQLINMGTFDGQQVNGDLVLACMQLGTGNCQKAINSSSCNGFADSNGTTICSMANKIGDGSTYPTDPGGGGNFGGGTPIGGGSNLDCIRGEGGACLPTNEAMAQAFQGAAGFSMSETKGVIYAIIAAGMLLLVAGILKDSWRMYAAGAIEKHVLMRVVLNIVISVSIVLLVISYT